MNPQFPIFELAPYPEESDIERLIKEKGLHDNPREIRARGLEEEWEEIRQRLLEIIIGEAEEKNTDHFGQGRRYIAFRINGLLAKFLFIKKARGIIVGGKKMRQCNSQSNIFRSHIEEHGLVRTYFTDMVPDTLAFQASFPTEHLGRFRQLSTVDPHCAKFMLQEAVFGGLSIADATNTNIAEIKTFRTQLETFLRRYEYMRREVGFIPEYPALKGKNVLVGQDGRLWVVDRDRSFSGA